MTVDPGQERYQDARDKAAYDRAMLDAYIEWFSYLETATRYACLKLTTLDSLDTMRIKALGQLKSALDRAADQHGHPHWFRVAAEEPPARL